MTDDKQSKEQELEAKCLELETKRLDLEAKRLETQGNKLQDKQSKEQDLETKRLDLEAKRLEIQESKLQMVADQQLDQQLNAVAGQVTPPSTQGRKSKTAAALLAFFLGVFGAHKFYIGANGAGVTMLLVSVLLFWVFFIPTIIIGIIAFVEFVIYLTKSDDEFYREYTIGKKAWF